MKRSLLIIVFFLLIANIGLAQSISYDRQTLLHNATPGVEP